MPRGLDAAWEGRADGFPLAVPERSRDNHRVQLATQSPFRPHDTPRRNAGQLVGLLVIDGERGWVRAGRPAYNAALAAAGALSCGRPRLVIGPSTEKRPRS
jgi:hypothetical protein